MSRKKLIKDNLIILIGGNIGNIFSLLTNFILLAQADKTLANLYMGYNSIVLILGVPALVSMRMLTVYGDSVITKINDSIKRRPNAWALSIFVFIASIFPIVYLISKFTKDGSLITAAMLFLLAVATFIVYSFRGLKQFEENFIAPTISLNVETLGRTILVFVFGVMLGWGIYGVLAAAIISMLLAIIPCFELIHFQKPKHIVNDYRFKTTFYNSFILTAGTEFFSNFDIAYSFWILNRSDVQAATELNALQLFRKIIFYGLYFTSGLFLSLGSKAKFTKRFTFFYTLGVSLGLGGMAALVCYLVKDIFLRIINVDLVILEGSDVLYFLGFTSLMSSAYILSNWLLSLKKRIYTFIPVIASVVQVFVFTLSPHNIHGLIVSFSITSGFYFVLSVIAGIYEVYFSKSDK